MTKPHYKGDRCFLQYNGLLHCIVCCLCLLAVTSEHTAAQDLEQIANTKPAAISGGIEARTVFYNAQGIESRYLPFNYFITGTPVISIYDVQIPVYFSVSRQQSSFTQPFNQFGLSPHYKWITLHGGYRNLQYSPFTLAGHTFLGGGVDLRPGKWRIGAMYGRFNKATVLDSLQGIYVDNFSFRRTGYAGRVGYGTDQNYINLITLHAKDDVGTAPSSEIDFLDSLRITPAENWVNGYQLRFSFLKQRLIVESDGALSLYTSDIRTSAIKDNSIQQKIEFFQNFTTINYSSELYGAFQASLMYKVKRMSMKLQYRYIEAGYKSMGAYFLNNDLENVTINPSMITLKGKVRFSGSLGFQRDNLQELKRATSHRVIGAANLSAEITENWGLDLSYTNFSNTQRARTLRFADSLRVAQSTQNFSVTPRYMKVTDKHSHSVLFSLNYNTFQELNQERILEQTGNNISTQNYFLTYQIGFLASQSSLFATANYTKLGNKIIKDQNTGLTIGGSKALLENKFLITVSSGYLMSDRNGERGTILNESLQLRYNVHPKHSFQIVGMFLGNYPDKETELQRQFTETRGEIGYSFNF